MLRAAELLNSMEEEPEADEDAEMTTPVISTFPNIILAGQSDPEEAALEAREINKYRSEERRVGKECPV